MRMTMKVNIGLDTVGNRVRERGSRTYEYHSQGEYWVVMRRERVFKPA